MLELITNLEQLTELNMMYDYMKTIEKQQFNELCNCEGDEDATRIHGIALTLCQLRLKDLDELRQLLRAHEYLLVERKHMERLTSPIL